MSKKGSGYNPLRAAGLVSIMGLNMAVCIFLGYFLGNLLGGSRGWVVCGILVGLSAGILSCVGLVKRVLEDSDG